MIPSVMTRYGSCAGQKEECVRFVNPRGLSEGDSMKKSLPGSVMSVKDAESVSMTFRHNFFRAPSTSQSLDPLSLLHGVESVQ
jgi:hypothetical protein